MRKGDWERRPIWTSLHKQKVCINCIQAGGNVSLRGGLGLNGGKGGRGNRENA